MVSLSAGDVIIAAYGTTVLTFPGINFDSVFSEVHLVQCVIVQKMVWIVFCKVVCVAAHNNDLEIILKLSQARVFIPNKEIMCYSRKESLFSV